MSFRAQELRRKRAEAITQARAIIDQAEKREAGKQTLGADEERQYGAFMVDVDSLQKEIEREERLSGMEVELGRSQKDPTKPATGKAEGRSAKDEAELRVFRRYLLNGRNSLTEAEHRALQADSDTAGGFLTTPKVFVNDLLKNVDDLLWIRQLATKYQVSEAQSLGVPSLDADPDDGDWTTEIKAVSFDSSMIFGDRELKPHPLTKGLKVSNKLMRLAMMNPEDMVRGRLAYKFALTFEKAYLTGNGAGRPLGVFVASTQGIPTSRDVSTGNTSTSITGDGILEAKYSLKEQYWAKANWIYHRDAVKQIAKLKDGEGQYLWQPGLQMGQPDRLASFPVRMSENAPNTFTASQYVGMVGDFSNYWIADALQVNIQRLDELYAETRQTGFIGEAASDGMPVLAEAFSRVKLGA